MAADEEEVVKSYLLRAEKYRHINLPGFYSRETDEWKRILMVVPTTWARDHETQKKDSITGLIIDLR